MCSHKDTIAPFVRSFVPLTMHLNFTSRDIIDNMFKNLALIIKPNKCDFQRKRFSQKCSNLMAYGRVLCVATLLSISIMF